MSREVIGDAPPSAVADNGPEPQDTRFAAVLRASRLALLPQATDVKPAPAEDRRTPAVAAVAAALLVGSATVGFAAADPPGDPARGVVATITGATSAASGETARRALLAISVVNPGRETVRVAGYAPSTRSSAATGLDRPAATVSAGEKLEITVDVALQCAAPAPLLLPDLLIREEDGSGRAVTVVGATAALTQLCAEGPATGRPLTVTGVRRDGADLLVDVAATSNRRAEVRRLQASGVELDAPDLPLVADRHPRTIRIRPPAECPSSWLEDGIPTGVDVEFDAAGPAIVHVPVGTPMAAWALDVVCGSP